MQEKHTPPAEQIKKTEEMLRDTPEGKQSEERAEIMQFLKPPSFNEKRGTALLLLDERLLHFGFLAAQAEQNGLQKKHEFHVTIIGNAHAKEIKTVLKTLAPEEQQKRIADLHALIQSTDWSFGTTRGTGFYHIKKEYRAANPKDSSVETVEARESYIQVLSIPALEEFYQRLNVLFGLSLKSPLPHITLYTKSTDSKNMGVGIGISARDDFASLNPDEIPIQKG